MLTQLGKPCNKLGHNRVIERLARITELFEGTQSRSMRLSRCSNPAYNVFSDQVFPAVETIPRFVSLTETMASKAEPGEHFKCD